MHKCKSYGPDKLNLWPFYIIWHSSVTLIFNIPEQIFQMALLHLKENNCAKLISNPCINAEVMAWTSSIYDHFILWPSSVTLTLNLPEQMFQMALLLLKENNCAHSTVPIFFFEIHAQMYKLWPGQIWTKTKQCTHAHTPNWSCNNYVSLTSKRFDKNVSSVIYSEFKDYIANCKAK